MTAWSRVHSCCLREICCSWAEILQSLIPMPQTPLRFVSKPTSDYTYCAHWYSSWQGSRGEVNPPLTSPAPPLPTLKDVKFSQSPPYVLNPSPDERPSEALPWFEFKPYTPLAQAVGLFQQTGPMKTIQTEHVVMHCSAGSCTDSKSSSIFHWNTWPTSSLAALALHPAAAFGTV